MNQLNGVFHLQKKGPGGEKRDLAWSKLDVNNWAKMKGHGKSKKGWFVFDLMLAFVCFCLGKLAMHFESDAHRAAVNRLLNFKRKSNNIDLMICSSRRQAEHEEDAIH